MSLELISRATLSGADAAAVSCVSEAAVVFLRRLWQVRSRRRRRKEDQLQQRILHN